MILILSKSSDHATGQVIRWLVHFQKSFIRINEDDVIMIEQLTQDNIIFSFGNEKFSLSDIESIWYRRGNLNINNFSIKIGNTNNITEGYNEMEIRELYSYIHTLFDQKKYINNYNYYDVNKLEILKYCHTNGLNDSDFLVTQSKKELMNFFEYNKGQVISKAINTPFVFANKEEMFSTYTYKVDNEALGKLPNSFTPTFFQKQLDKKYEIRTFFLENKFYSMAIFSQGNSKTQVDFRHYDQDYPNRVTPFRLPPGYRKKICNMLKSFKINCASMDTIITTDNKYYMIDVNPIGQFGMTSKPCNYNLEKLLAEHLSYEK